MHKQANRRSQSRMGRPFLQSIALYRVVRIVWLSVKFFLQLYWFSRRHPKPWSEVEQTSFANLMARQAREYRELALRLEGLMIKLGQFLSTRADIMPQAFLKELEHLVDQVPPVRWEAVDAILDEEWKSRRALVASIRQESVASASIGIVYKATLQSGEQVAVKVRRPGIDRIIRADFRALWIVLWMARQFTTYGRRADLRGLYREMVAVITDELNFVKEMQNGEYFRERYENIAGVHIPRYFAELSTRRVLVMEWMDGARISDLAYLQAQGLDRHELAARLFHSFTEQLFEAGKFHADPHPGNLLVQPDGTIVILDFGMVGMIREQDVLYIRDLIEGIVFEDADKILDALAKLRFLLPSADRTVLEPVIMNLIAAYARSDLTRFDEAVLDQILRDVQEAIAQQPIQLPSEFAFLGRALSTFTGVLHTLDPGIDIAALGKPIIRQWLAEHTTENPRSQSTGGAQEAHGEAAAGAKGTDFFARAMADAVNSAQVRRLLRQYGAPLLRYPRLVEQALEAPTKQLEGERERARAERVQRYFQTQKAYAFVQGTCASILWALGVWWHLRPFTILGAVALAGAVLWFYRVSRRQARWLLEQDGQRLS
ncbi:MAG: AarF/UbiB family protein [Firmicutes bacterium]|nr:AarF/UbiB family protein [Bacillota bacterium]